MLAFFKTMRMEQTYRCILHIGQPVFIKEPVSFFQLEKILFMSQGQIFNSHHFDFLFSENKSKIVSQFTKQFLTIVFILIFGIDSVFQNHAIEINREMYKNIDTPIEFLRNNEFLFLLNINFILQISIMTPKVI